MHLTQIGCCASPTVGYMVTIEDNSSTCEVEGSHITYYCQPGLVPSERKMAYCMNNGSWSPDPHDLKCHPATKNTSIPESPNFGTLHSNFIAIGA